MGTTCAFPTGMGLGGPYGLVRPGGQAVALLMVSRPSVRCLCSASANAGCEHQCSAGDARFVAFEARIALFTLPFPALLMPVGTAGASLPRLPRGQAVALLMVCLGSARRRSTSQPIPRQQSVPGLEPVDLRGRVPVHVDAVPGFHRRGTVQVPVRPATLRT